MVFQDESLKAYEGNDPYIFMSYCHKDSGKVAGILRTLQKHYNVWYDEGIKPGHKWRTVIVEHQNKCGFFLALISQNYLSSETCMDELYYARKRGLPFLLILIGEVKLSDEVVWECGRYQYLKYRDYEDEKELLNKIKDAPSLECCRISDDGHIPAPSPVTTTARPEDATPASVSSSEPKEEIKLPPPLADNAKLGELYLFGRGVKQDFYLASALFSRGNDPYCEWLVLRSDPRVTGDFGVSLKERFYPTGFPSSEFTHNCPHFDADEHKDIIIKLPFSENSDHRSIIINDGITCIEEDFPSIKSYEDMSSTVNRDHLFHSCGNIYVLTINRWNVPKANDPYSLKKRVTLATNTASFIIDKLGNTNNSLPPRSLPSLWLDIEHIADGKSRKNTYSSEELTWILNHGTDLLQAFFADSIAEER